MAYFQCFYCVDWPWLLFGQKRLKPTAAITLFSSLPDGFSRFYLVPFFLRLLPLPSDSCTHIDCLIFYAEFIDILCANSASLLLGFRNSFGMLQSGRFPLFPSPNTRIRFFWAWHFLFNHFFLFF